MSVLQVSGICSSEGEDYMLQDISFMQQALQRTAICGATGSGKTTLLKIIGGRLQPAAGEVFLDGQRVEGPLERLIPGHPQIGYLSQHFELLNHYRVEEVLEMSARLTPGESERIYTVCRIRHLLKRWTHQLSGGERQRIALARLLVSAPKLLLLDEPYSNLDAYHKDILRMVIADMEKELGITCLLVSHDPADVLSWAEKVIVLEQGRVIQQGSPEQVFYQPVNDYAAGLMGKYNLVGAALFRKLAAHTGVQADQVNRFLRPGQFRLSSEEGMGLEGRVQSRSFLGNYVELSIELAGLSLIVNTTDAGFRQGDTVFVSLAQ